MENFKIGDKLKNVKTGEIIIIDNVSKFGCYYHTAKDNQKNFKVFAALEMYEKIQSTDEKFVDEFTKGYLDACELLKNTPPAEWGKVIGDIGGAMKHIVTSINENVDAMEKLVSKFKTE